MNLINRFRCWFFGHPRGKRVPNPSDEGRGVRWLRCPRCGAEWTRKIPVSRKVK